MIDNRGSFTTDVALGAVSYRDKGSNINLTLVHEFSLKQSQGWVCEISNIYYCHRGKIEDTVLFMPMSSDASP